MIIHVLSIRYLNFRSLRWILFKSEGFYTKHFSISRDQCNTTGIPKLGLFLTMGFNGDFDKTFYLSEYTRKWTILHQIVRFLAEMNNITDKLVHRSVNGNWWPRDEPPGRTLIYMGGACEISLNVWKWLHFCSKFYPTDTVWGYLIGREPF